MAPPYRRRSSTALRSYSTVVLLSTCATLSNADPMVPSRYIKQTNYRDISSSQLPFKKTHAERMEYRVRSWKAVHETDGSNTGPLPADYGGTHPFEIMAKDRREEKKETQQQREQNKPPPHTQLRRGLLSGGTYPGEWYESDWQLDPDSDSSSWYPSDDNRHDFSNYQPLRIGLNFDRLPSDGASQDKNRFVQNVVMRAAVQFWSKALSVYPAKNIRVDPDYCEDLPPSTHKTEGVDDVDLMLYVYAEKFCGGGQMAAAAGCSWDQYNRPVGGVVRFCYDSIMLNADGTADALTEMTNVETAIHEVGHVLGLKSDEMAFYYDHKTGEPRNDNIDITQGFECLDGTRKDVNVPSESTLKKGSTASGIEYYEVVTPTVAQIARNHFNCPTMQGMRLENQPTNPDDCFGSHFEERLLWNGLLTGLAETAHIPQYLTPFTLGLFEDSGWYKANFGMSRSVAFGHGAGCDFVEKNCINEKGELDPPFDQYFCNTMDTRTTFGCDPEHNMVATCDMVDVTTLQGAPDSTMNIPKEMQYFDDPNLGSLNPQPDYCPIFSQYIGLSCRKEPTAPGFDKDKWFPGESFAENSRCFNSDFARPLCLETVCNEETYKIDIIIDGETKTCQNDGDKIPITAGNTEYNIDCPRFANICPNLVCPSSCAGQGDCRWDVTDGEVPYCKCFDSTLKSANCNDMPPSDRQSSGETPTTGSGDTASSSDEVIVTPGGEVKGYTKAEQFMKCQHWCQSISNKWEEKCEYTFSCGLCSECSEMRR